MAGEIKSIRSEVIAFANTSYGTRSLFNGTAAGAAYTAGGAYLGNSASVIRDVAPSTTVAVNLTGPEIFGTAGGPVGDVFEVLDRLAAGDHQRRRRRHRHRAHQPRREDGAAERRHRRTGNCSARLEDAKSVLRTPRCCKTQLSQVEDVDIVDALIQVKAQENSYQAALQVAATSPVSLLDYLR